MNCSVSSSLPRCAPQVHAAKNAAIGVSGSARRSAGFQTRLKNSTPSSTARSSASTLVVVAKKRPPRASV
eukprot:7563157-Lingulodinium_polyedra.AAC.1